MISRDELIEVMARALNERANKEYNLYHVDRHVSMDLAENMLDALLAALPEERFSTRKNEENYLKLLAMKRPPHPNTKEP